VNTNTRARTRRFAVIAGALSLSFAVAGCAPGNDAGGSSEPSGTVVVSSYGGAFQEAQQTALFTPFEDESGITVKATEGTGFDPLKAQVDAGDVAWDVVSLESGPFANAVKNDLLEPLDFDVIDTTGLAPEVVSDYGVGYIQFSVNLVWDNAVTGPLTPEQFFDPSVKLPRSLGTSPTVMLEFALLADGVKPEDLYPLDVDRAFEVLDRVKDQIVAFKDASDAQALMQQGEVAAALLPAGRAEDAIKAGSDWGYTWAGAVRDTEYWTVAKGAKNPQDAMKFIAFAIGAEPQAALAEAIPYGPSNSDAYALLSDELNEKLPSSPDNAKQGVTLDSAFWADNLDEIKTRWDAWLLQ